MSLSLLLSIVKKVPDNGTNGAIGLKNVVSASKKTCRYDTFALSRSINLHRPEYRNEPLSRHFAHALLPNIS